MGKKAGSWRGKRKRYTVTGYVPATQHILRQQSVTTGLASIDSTWLFLPIVRASSCLISGQGRVQWDTVVSRPYQDAATLPLPSFAILVITVIIVIARRFLLTIEIGALRRVTSPPLASSLREICNVKNHNDVQRFVRGIVTKDFTTRDVKFRVL